MLTRGEKLRKYHGIFTKIVIRNLEMSWDINFKSPRHPGLKKKAERRQTAEVA